MFTSDQYRREARKYRQRAQEAAKPAEEAEFRALEHSFETLANNAEWLVENSNRLIPGVNYDSVSAGLTGREEHMLQCLGAALIMHWEKLPTKLQRELCEAVGSISDGLAGPVVREQMARFLGQPGDEKPQTAPRSMDAPKPIRSRDIYRSPNGDAWQLMHDEASGRAWVRHVANAPSGGSVSELEIDAFLRQGGSAPEKQELLRMLGSPAQPSGARDQV